MDFAGMSESIKSREDAVIGADAVKGLVKYLISHQSFTGAQFHPSMEAWAAVETFAHFGREGNCWSAGGTLPYLSLSYRGEEKWTDAYARFVVDNVARIHLWIEFKAIPFGATSARNTLMAYAKDIRSLGGMLRPNTCEFWASGVNPNTGKNHLTWLKKHTFRGSLLDGSWFGVAILFFSVANDAELSQSNSRILELTNEYAITTLVQTRAPNDGLGVLAHFVEMKCEQRRSPAPTSAI